MLANTMVGRDEGKADSDMSWTRGFWRGSVGGYSGRIGIRWSLDSRGEASEWPPWVRVLPLDMSIAQDCTWCRLWLQVLVKLEAGAQLHTAAAPMAMPVSVARSDESQGVRGHPALRWRMLGDESCWPAVTFCQECCTLRGASAPRAN